MLKIKLFVISTIMLGCTAPVKEIETLKLNAEVTRLRVYENHLRICGTFGIACGTAAQSQEERAVCSELMEHCVAEAEESYRADTGKEPPGSETK